MKILKNILVGFGAIFMLLIGLAIFLAGSSAEFKEKHEQFVRDFTREFSQNWEIDSVKVKITNELQSQIKTTKGKHALKVFSSLGRLIEITDMELLNYSAHTSGPTTGVFKFKAKFDNAYTIVSVTVQEMDNTARVNGFHIEPIGDISQSKEIRV